MPVGLLTDTLLPMPIAPNRILFEDEHLLAVNKLAGELVVAASGEGKKPLFDFLKKDYPGLRVLHRLDYQTSGIIVFAKSAAVVEHVRATKFDGWVKTYRALCVGRVEQQEGTLTTPLKARTHEGLVPATSHYKVLRLFPDASFVEVKIDTGRKHQIRQHMASIHHPLFLDPLYGDRSADIRFTKRFHFRRFFLHSALLVFPHPITGQIISLHAPLPPAFNDVFDQLATTGALSSSRKLTGGKRLMSGKKKAHLRAGTNTPAGRRERARREGRKTKKNAFTPRHKR